MANIKLICKNAFEEKADMYAFFVDEGKEPEKFILDWALDSGVNLKAIFKQQKFIGKPQSHCVVPMTKNKVATTLCFLGVSSKCKCESRCIESYRRQIGTLVRVAEKYNISDIVLKLPGLKAGSKKIDISSVAKETAISFGMAEYHFNDFITDKSAHLNKVKNVSIIIDTKSKNSCLKAVSEGQIISEAVNNARHWVDLPPKSLNPEEVEKKAKKIAKDLGLKITVFNDEHEMIVYRELNETYSALKNDYDSLESSHTELTNEYQSLQDKYDSLEYNHTELTDEYQALQDNYDSLESNYTELTDEYQALRDEHENLVLDHELLSEELETIVNDLSTKTNILYAVSVTTILFIAATVYFAKIKQRV